MSVQSVGNEQQVGRLKFGFSFLCNTPIKNVNLYNSVYIEKTLLEYSNFEAVNSVPAKTSFAKYIEIYYYETTHLCCHTHVGFDLWNTCAAGSFPHL